MSQKSYDQAFIERRYQQWAKVYDWLTPFYLLGAEKRLRKNTISALHLQPGQTVLDLACGTGRNFPLIEEAIGPAGKLVGVDYTGAMLARAQERVAREGWKNVELVQADAAQVNLGRQFDAVLCTLAFGVIPDGFGVISRMKAHLKPGGRLAIGDAKRSSGWNGWALNWVAELLGYGAAEVMTRKPWLHLRKQLDDFQYEEWFAGFYYVTGGRLPTSHPANKDQEMAFMGKDHDLGMGPETDSG